MIRRQRAGDRGEGVGVQVEVAAVGDAGTGAAGSPDRARRPRRPSTVSRPPSDVEARHVQRPAPAPAAGQEARQALGLLLGLLGFQLGAELAGQDAHLAAIRK